MGWLLTLGENQQFEVVASFVRVCRSEKAFSCFQSFFNHTLNHFSRDELMEVSDGEPDLAQCQC